MEQMNIQGTILKYMHQENNINFILTFKEMERRFTRRTKNTKNHVRQKIVYPITLLKE